MATATMENETKDGDKGRPWLKYGLIGAALVALVAAYQFLPVQDWAEAYRGWLEDLGWVGWIAFVVIYALATAALVPGAILTLAGGLAYGLWAFPLVILGATAGAAIAFLAARYLARDWVEAKMDEHPKFKAIDSAIREDGWKVVGLLRLSPALPFSLQNWFLGTSSVGFLPAMTATFFGIMPGTLLYVWLGSIGGDAASGGGSLAKYGFLAVGLVATLAVTIIVGRKAKAKLKEHGLRDAE